MILVDTSVWVAYFRATDRQLVAHLQELLGEDRVALALPVKIEILSGSSKRDLARLRKVLSALPMLIPSRDTWNRMDEWVDIAVSRGERFGVADLLIAALAAEQEVPLWSLDRDFARMQKLGFLQLHAPS